MQEVLTSLWDAIKCNELYMVMFVTSASVWLLSVITVFYRFCTEDYRNLRGVYSCSGNVFNENVHNFVKRTFKSFMTFVVIASLLVFVIWFVYSSIPS